MEKTCTICTNEGKYKCPTCPVYYCSVPCCKHHRENGCDVWLRPEDDVHQQPQIEQSRARYTTADTVPVEKLMLLRGDEELKAILSNPHLRRLLTEVNNAENSERAMQMAMQEPLFVEFADGCLRVVAPPRDE